jgi:hypothetical protein
LIIKTGYSFITKKPIQGEAKERSLYATARICLVIFVLIAEICNSEGHNA